MKRNLNPDFVLPTSLSYSIREAAKKNRYFFSGPATKREGEGLRAWPLRKKTVFGSSKKNSGKKFVASLIYSQILYGSNHYSITIQQNPYHCG